MWYVIQVKTGDELAIKNKLDAMNILAFVPRENRPIRSGGTWNNKEYILFPSYVFININFNAENYYKIKNIPSVIRFLGESSSPSTLSYLEAEWIKILSGINGQPIEPTKVKEVDGNIEVVGGVLQHFANKAIKYNKHNRKATFEITVCNEIKTVQLGIEILDSPDRKSVV